MRTFVNMPKRMADGPDRTNISSWTKRRGSLTGSLSVQGFGAGASLRAPADDTWQFRFLQASTPMDPDAKRTITMVLGSGVVTAFNVPA